MKLVGLHPMLHAARHGRYAVGAFNFCNAETAKAIIDEGTCQRSPVILNIGPLEVPLVGARMLVEIVRSASHHADIPVCLHLDRAVDLVTVRECIEAGFPSVAIDGSRFDYKENISLTREVVRIAHSQGVTVEGVLGEIGRVGSKNKTASFTDPEMAMEFVESTRVDALAVSIGNAHGIYARRPIFDFELLKAIRESAGAPLVLHGGSGTPPELLRRMIEIGICKVNVSSEIHKAFIEALKPSVESGGKVWYSHALIEARNAVAKVARHWMQDLDSVDKV